MKNIKRFTLRLTEEQIETLKEIASKERRTMAAVLRNFIDDIKKAHRGK